MIDGVFKTLNKEWCTPGNEKSMKITGRNVTQTWEKAPEKRSDNLWGYDYLRRIGPKKENGNRLVKNISQSTHEKVEEDHLQLIQYVDTSVAGGKRSDLCEDRPNLILNWDPNLNFRFFTLLLSSTHPRLTNFLSVDIVLLRREETTLPLHQRD